MIPRILLPLFAAFKAMDGRRKDPPKRSLNFKDDNNNDVKATLRAYSADPEGYNGPRVMECLRPSKASPRNAPPSTVPEALHLYYQPNAGSIKKAYVPIGEKGDSYLLAVVSDIMDEMEAGGEDGKELTLPVCMDAVTEHLDLGDDKRLVERRLNAIW